MREHWLMFLQYRLRRAAVSMAPFQGLPLAWHSLRYLLTRGGIMAAGRMMSAASSAHGAASSAPMRRS